jgi:hypothetical protein
VVGRRRGLGAVHDREQKSAVAETHPKDMKARRMLQEVVDQLEAALRTHLAR